LSDAKVVKPNPAAGRVIFKMAHHQAGGFTGFGASTASLRSLVVRLSGHGAKPILENGKRC